MASSADTSGPAVAWSVAGLILYGLLAAGPVRALGVETRELPVAEFQRVHFSGAGTVRLSQGSPPRLALRGRGGILDDVRVEVQAGLLTIEASGLAAGDLVVDLRVETLEEFVNEGDARITGDDFALATLRLEGHGAGGFDFQRLEVDELVVTGRGATWFDLSGQVGRQRVDLAGTGTYRAGELISKSVSVSVAGASDVQLWVEELLTVDVAGAADIRYLGSPRLEQRISGVASVERLAQIAI